MGRTSLTRLKEPAWMAGVHQQKTRCGVRQVVAPWLRKEMYHPDLTVSLRQKTQRGTLRLTETRRATPVHPPPSPFPNMEKRKYELKAANGVEALKIARCFLQSDRGRLVASKDVEYARAVGAIIAEICRKELSSIRH